MMKRLTHKCLLAAAAGAMLAAAAAPVRALTPEEAFVGAPDEVVAAIDSMTRLDMLDYYRSGSERPSKNAFGGDSRVLALDSLSITVGTSAAGTITFVPLVAKSGDSLVMVVRTLQTPAPDSYVSFYTADWRPLSAKKFIRPLRLADWLTPEGEARRKDVENIVPFVLAEATFDPATRTLTFANTMDRYFSEEEWANVQRWLKPSVAMKVR